MAVHLRVLLILTGLTGIHGITTVSDVSVKIQESISIPCLYGSQYLNHVKYLCEGFYWTYCTYAVKTNQQNSPKFSISDDKSQRVFTVTINDVTYSHYWCAVEIDGGPDVKEYFNLAVTTDIPRISVARQEVEGTEGDNITIKCYYTNHGEMKWCRLGGSCVTTTTTTSGSIAGTTVTIGQSAQSDVFTVTMSGLRTESSGWYWCGKGDLQMPVHVTVTEPPTTTTSHLTTTAHHLTSFSPTAEPVNITHVFADPTPTTVEAERQRVSVDVKSVIIPSSILIFILMMTLVIWIMLKRHKQTKAAAAELKGNSHAEDEVNVTYSSVVITKKHSGHKVEADDENVTYSTLA